MVDFNPQADEATEDWLFRILESTRESLVISDPTRDDNPIVYANESFYRLTGYAPAEVIGKNCRFLQGPQTDPAAVGLIRLALQNQKYCEVDILNYRKDGGAFWNHLLITPVFHGGQLIGFVGVQHDSTGRIREARAREAARAAAEKASREKSLFISTFAHEIRTPLNVIVGFADSLMEGQVEDLPPEISDRIRHIRTAGKMLAGLVTDVLQATRIESGSMSVRSTHFPPREILDTAAVIHRPLAESAGIDLSFETAAGTPALVETDRVKLGQIVMNLVDNALKFTPRNGRVRVRLEPGLEDSFRIVVADTGRGIPADKLHKIFDAFSQIDAGDVKQGAGIGLGLAITRKLVLLLEGELEVESEPGQGTTFTLSFPRVLARPPDSPAEKIDAQDAPRVLVADDDYLSRELMRVMLSELDLSCDIVGDGQAALLQTATRRPDLVFLDRHMPELDGTETARKLKALPDCANLPIVLLSGDEPDAAIRTQRDRSGRPLFSDALEKPITLDGLRQIVSKYLVVRT